MKLIKIYIHTGKIMFKPMTYEEVLNKAKYILFESYCSNNDEKAKYDIETNKQSVIDFLKDN